MIRQIDMQQHRMSIISLYEKSSLQNEPICRVRVCVSRSHLEDPRSALDVLVSGADEGWGEKRGFLVYTLCAFIVINFITKRTCLHNTYIIFKHIKCQVAHSNLQLN